MSYVLGLEEINGSMVALVGGKGASLGELMRIEGVSVPGGFCVTTEAAGDPAAVPAIRAAVQDGVAYAVRSSATAEDSPTASFAGQHDTFLNVVGADAVLDAVRRCWDSLHSERAVAYRAQGEVHEARMAVVVQQMVAPRASGVLFTADPLTSSRKVASVEAIAGLGEALVSGHVNPDTYSVRDGEVSGEGVLSADEVLALVGLGKRIEAHFGRPQDIEWCLDEDGFAIVQSRPITTLYPIPASASDGEPHVYISVGHQQMMTDPMKPLGISFWQLTAGPPMHEAAGRLFVDATRGLSSGATRAGLLEMIETGDPLVGDALRTVLDRGFIPLEEAPAVPPAEAPAPIEVDPAIVSELIAANEASVAAAAQAIEPLTGTALLDFILEDINELKRLLFDRRSHQVFMSAMDASLWLNRQIEEWLGEKNVADTLTQSVPNNVTSEMGLALLDVADAIRPHPEAVAALERGELTPVARDALQPFLDAYGMRCVGEIDITRPRWSEQPEALVPLILGNVRGVGPGEGKRRFEQGRLEAEAKAAEVLERLRALPDGERLAAETAAQIERVRTYIGYREYPKYGIIARYRVYKQALMAEAARVAPGDVEDIFFLTFQELRAVVAGGEWDPELVAERKRAFRVAETLTPPRVLTSDGETFNGAYRRDDAPHGALIGLPVSSGTVEGRARVVLDLADAEFEPGDILVTRFTDPSWSATFVVIAGLVTEVGGLMTHGAVIAREYGLPAVVGVEDATGRIRDGQRIRVDGTDGYVELLD